MFKKLDSNNDGVISFNECKINFFFYYLNK